MDSLLAFLTPFVSFIVTIILIIFVFVFVINPILNYFILNREIENRKKLAIEYQKAKRDAAENHSEVSTGRFSVDSIVDSSDDGDSEN